MIKKFKIIAVVNQKGGSGKTTTSIGLLGCLMSSGINTFYIDTDKHGKAAHLLAGNVEEGSESWLSKHVHVCPSGEYQDVMNLIDEISDSTTQFVIIDTPALVTEAFMTATDIADVLIVPGKMASHDVSLTLKSAKALAKTKNKPVFIQPTEIEKGHIMDDDAIESYQNAANEIDNLFLLPFIRKSAAIIQGLNIGLTVF